MKNLIVLIVVLAIISLESCAKTGMDVPVKAKTAFSQKFPDATNVKWQKENDNEWEAEFTWNEKEYSANFDNQGTWMETEYKISTDEIPVAVKTTLDEEFSEYTIEESELSETAVGKIYEIELKKGEVELEVTIDMKGNVIQKEQIKKNDAEDKD